MVFKDIVMLILGVVVKYGEKNLIVRIKFMIEIIIDFKNNKFKVGVGVLVIVLEYIVKMKKILG